MKSVGSKGIKARDLKETDEETTELMRDVMNVITKQGSTTPSSWKKVMVKVLYKQKKIRRNQKTTEHFVSCRRCTHVFHDALQHCTTSSTATNFLDHCGFRKIQTTDHLMAYRLIVRKCRECEQTSRQTNFKSRLTRYGTKPLYQWATHLCSEKFACWPTRHFADGRGEWWIRGCSRHETRRSFQQLSAQFGSPVINGDRHWDLEGEELWHQIGRRKKGLYIKPEICWCRSSAGKLLEPTQKNKKDARKRKG